MKKTPKLVKSDVRPLTLSPDALAAIAGGIGLGGGKSGATSAPGCAR